jgi:hypothetical protein
MNVQRNVPEQIIPYVRDLYTLQYSAILKCLAAHATLFGFFLLLLVFIQLRSTGITVGSIFLYVWKNVLCYGQQFRSICFLLFRSEEFVIILEIYWK